HVNADQVALRSRESPYPIIPVKQAVSIVLESVSLLPVEPVEITCALGRYLAASVYAADPLPPFCASIKDGYAVK
ncbi:gephyrin, partial [Biomphalaria glabrata]